VADGLLREFKPMISPSCEFNFVQGEIYQYYNWHLNGIMLRRKIKSFLKYEVTFEYLGWLQQIKAL